MFNFKELESKYQSSSTFNKLVNLHRQAIEEYGFTPEELRQATFLAQYMYQMNHAQEIIRTQEEWQKIFDSRVIMQEAILKVKSL